jgi:hypothetical protein
MVAVAYIYIFGGVTLNRGRLRRGGGRGEGAGYVPLCDAVAVVEELDGEGDEHEGEGNHAVPGQQPLGQQR